MKSYYLAILVATTLSPIYGQDVIRTKDLGKDVELHGVSGKPVGTVWSGVLRRVENIDGKTVVTISLENSTGKNEFVFFRDEKFNDFIRIEGVNVGINSSLNRMVGEKIFGRETYVSIGVPREFIASINDLTSGPFFEQRTVLSISLAEPERRDSLQNSHNAKSIRIQDLSSGKVRLVGRLGSPIGTVLECKCDHSVTGSLVLQVGSNSSTFTPNEVEYWYQGGRIDSRKVNISTIKHVLCFEKLVDQSMITEDIEKTSPKWPLYERVVIKVPDSAYVGDNPR